MDEKKEYKVIAPSVFNKDSQVEQNNRWYTKEEAEKTAIFFFKTIQL